MTNEEIVIRIKAGIDVANNMAALYEQNRGMIGKIAFRYQGYAEMDDLMQEGYIALCSAVDGYKPEESSFIHYAVFWIRQRMQRYIESCGSCLRVPAHQRQRISKYKKLHSQYQQEFGHKPSDWEMAGFLGLSLKVYREIEKDVLQTNLDTLDRCVGEEGDTSIGELIASDVDIEGEVLEKVQQEQLQNVIWPLVETLPGKQSAVIRARFQEHKTLKEISEILGCHLSCARQLESNGLYELRKPGRSRQLQPFIEDYIDTYAYRGGGAGTFNRTWTSSTEYAALGLAEMGIRN